MAVCYFLSHSVSVSDVRNRLFLFRFGVCSVFEKKLRFGSECVWFSSVKKRDSVPILQLFTTRVIAE